MPWLPKKLKAWPQDAPDSPEKIQELYEAGFCGAMFSQEVHEEFEQFIRDQGNNPNGGEVATRYGFADSGAGKLVMPFLHVLDTFPGCWPGPPQERGDCVSWGTRNGCLVSVMGDVYEGKPDEVTGEVEGAPECPQGGVEHGVLSTEYIYWWRGRQGHGWYCEAAGIVVVERGLMVRQAYPELGIDLTRYSGRQTEVYGARQPPANILAVGKVHHIRTATNIRTPEQARDYLANFNGVSNCSSINGTTKRDENGVVGVRPYGGHSQALIAYDDRPETHQKYGDALALWQNSHGKNWIGGPRTIRDSAKYVPASKKADWIAKGIVDASSGDILIPEGAFWLRAKELKRTSMVAFSGAAGWKRQKLPNWGTSAYLG